MIEIKLIEDPIGLRLYQEAQNPYEAELELYIPGAGVTAPPSPPEPAPAPEPAFSPADIAGLVGWFDASDTASLTLGAGDEITQIRNRAPGGTMDLIAGPGGGPTYAAAHPTAGNRPAAVWPNSVTQIDMRLSAAVDVPIRTLFMVLAYGDGSVAAAPTYSTMLSDQTGNVRATVFAGQSDPVWIGYSADPALSRSPLLPLPLSVLRIDAPPEEPLIINRFGDGANNAWQGPICEVLAYTTPPAASEVTQIETHLSEKWGITTG